MQEVKLNVDGMTCMGCVKNVKNALTNLDGVSNVDVDLDSQEAKLTIDEIKVNVKKVIDELDDIGFQAVQK